MPLRDKQLIKVEKYFSLIRYKSGIVKYVHFDYKSIKRIMCMAKTTLESSSKWSKKNS